MPRRRPRFTRALVAGLAVLGRVVPAAAVEDPGPREAGAAPATTLSDDPAALRLDGRPAALRSDETASGDPLSGLDGKARALVDAPEAASVAALADQPCEDGRAGIYPCENVDLLSLVPNAALGGANGNDIWGWTDPETGAEVAIMGTGYGTTFVDVTEPTAPVVLGYVPTRSAANVPLWRDVKVHDDHALIVSEHDFHGMQVFDLTRLRDLETTPQPLTPDVVYGEFGNAHNLAVNEDTGYAYAVGSDTCEGGLHMIDVREPAAPEFAGCFADDGYTHDVQCVVSQARGELRGRELCFASNEDTVTIVDVTDKQAPRLLSRTGYDEAAYTHQGWLTPDQRWFLFGDELDEQEGTVDATTTYIMDVSDPTDPGDPVPYTHDTPAIDHNLYLDEDFVYQANYTAGLRILAHDDELLSAGRLDEVAFFEVVPEVDVAEFAGAWSSYPYFPSGTVVVSTIEQGLFVLRPDLPESEQPGRSSGARGDGFSSSRGRPKQ